MLNVEILGIGKYLPKKTININGQTRYRMEGEAPQLNMAILAINEALNRAGMKINDIDCIVSACAVGVQPIPCTAALVHEKIAKGMEIPAIDINTTCTSFITAFDLMSNMIECGKYRNVLIFSSEYASLGINVNQKESYELFSDGAAAVVIGKSRNKESKVFYAMQKTWSEGAHDTEIRGGLTGLPANKYNENNRDDFYFDMHGRKVLTLAIKKLPNMFEQFYERSNLNINDIDMVVPHQASAALAVAMKKLNISKDKYIDYVKEYGNMVSASVPVALCSAIEEGRIKKGDRVLLFGTAARINC